MKYSIFMVSTITLIAAFVLSGCDSPSNRMENAETSVIEANRDLEMAETEVEADLLLFRAENEDKVMEYNRTISEIKQKIENESDMDVRVNLERKLDEYEVSLRSLNSEMNNYQASGRENWDEFKDGFSNRMDNLGDSLENFFSAPNTTTNTSTN